MHIGLMHTDTHILTHPPPRITDSGTLSRCAVTKKTLRSKGFEKKIKGFERETTIYQSNNKKAGSLFIHN